MISTRPVNSSQWMKEHFKDRYVKEAKRRKLRSRSWFKLEEINKKNQLFKRGMSVIDLGSAPGGWSAYVSNQVGSSGRVIACDILPMSPIPGVNFLQGDFKSKKMIQSISTLLGKNKVHVVLSDMSPNISGKSSVDVPRSIHLAELALEMCQENLATSGIFLVKVFQGEGFDDFIKKTRFNFAKVNMRKPNASRARSREVYILATGYQ